MYFAPYDAEVQRLIRRSPDPIRWATVALALRSLYRDALEGSLAEVGVYRGELSRLIRTAAPDRTLYLFDTFSGFPEQDLERDRDTRFRDTSIETVRRSLAGLDGVVLRPGYFPDTAAGLEDERFAFVMIDVDLFKPTLAALNFFYPRMVSGGYVMAHDFNSTESNRGVSRAFNQFLPDKPERLVEFADPWGSVAFRKI
jgi:O-methyltransferase